MSWSTPGAPAATDPAAYYASLTPEQQMANWQQWQQYQEQYAAWHAQYGEQYAKQMQSMAAPAPATPAYGYSTAAQPPLPPGNPPATAPLPAAYPPAPAAAPPTPAPSTYGYPGYSAPHQLAQPPMPYTAPQSQYPPPAAPYQPYQQPPSIYQATPPALQPPPQTSGLPNFQQPPPPLPDTSKPNSRPPRRWEQDGKKNNGGQNKNDRKAENNNQWGAKRFKNNQNAPRNNDFSKQVDSELTEEEKQFEIQYQQWENEFLKWREQNINHPDKKAFDEYEKKFEQCRERLLARREQMRQKKLERAKEQQLKIKEEEEEEEDIEYQHEKAFQEQRPINAASIFQSSFNHSGIPGLDLTESEPNPREVDTTPTKPKEPKTLDLTYDIMRAPRTQNISDAISHLKGNPQVQALLTSVGLTSETPSKVQRLSLRPVTEALIQITGRNFREVLEELQNASVVQQVSKPPPQKDPNVHVAASGIVVKPPEPITNFQAPPPMWNQPPPSTHQSWPPPNSNPNSSFGPPNSSPSFGPPNSSPGFGPPNSSPGFGPPNSSPGFGPPNSNQGPNFGPPRNNFNQDIRGWNENRPPPQMGKPMPFGRSRFQSPNDSFNPYQKPPNDDFNSFHKPATVIDYANKKNGGNPNYNAVKVVDYQHGEFSRNDDYFDVGRSFDYDHESDHRRRPGEQQDYGESNPTYPSKWVLISERPPLVKRTKRGKRKNRKGQVIENKKFRKPDEEEFHTPVKIIDYALQTQETPESESKVEIEEEKPKPAPRSKRKQAGPDDSLNVYPPSDALKYHPNVVSLDEILLDPGRATRPPKIVLIFRGPPGSGKSTLAKIIKDQEQAISGSAPRIMSVDDYFLNEKDLDEFDPKLGRTVRVKGMVYEYDPFKERQYMGFLMKNFKKTIQDELFNFIIVDCWNDQLKEYEEFYDFSKQHGYTPFTIELLYSLEMCMKHNEHKRLSYDIRTMISEWQKLPPSHVMLDATNLIQFSMTVPPQEEKPEEEPAENVEDKEEESKKDEEAPEEEDVGNEDNEAGVEQNPHLDGNAKPIDKNWSTELLATKLDGVNKPIKHPTIDDFLQLDGWEPPEAPKDGKKRVRWADIEERREQQKLKAIGFVVGQTDWNRILDTSEGSNALNKIKFIEKIPKN